MAKSQTHIPCLVNRVAYGEFGKLIQKRFEYLLDHNGPEWTAQRYKAIWNAALLLREGRKDDAISLLQDKSISFSHSTGFPKDPIGVVVRDFVHATKPKQIKRATAALRSYTALRIPKIKSNHIEKVRQSISAPVSGQQVFEEALQKAGQYVELGSRAFGLQGQWRDVAREEISLDHLRPFTSCYSPVKHPTSCKDDPYSKALLSLMTSPPIPEVRDSILYMFSKDIRYVEEKSKEYHPDDHVGKIHLIPELGCKVRAVAIPNAWSQLAFVPLDNQVSAMSADLIPNSFVKKQQDTSWIISNHMEKGGYVGSTDLSSATDRFPLSLQLRQLRQIGCPPDYIRAFEKTAQSKWLLPDGSSVSYSIGQPMGLYGSFSTFNMTHCSLIKGIEYMIENIEDEPLRRFHNTDLAFMVLGDDVVFSDKRLKTSYEKILKDLDVNLSHHKSFEGNLTEFAGFLVSRLSGKIPVTSFRPYKQSDGSRLPNVQNFLANLGSSASVRSKRWEKLYKEFNRTSHLRNHDLSPIFNMRAPGPVMQGTRFSVPMMRSVVNNLYLQLPRSVKILDYEKLPGDEPIIWDGFRNVSKLQARYQSRDRYSPKSANLILDNRVDSHKGIYDESYSKDPLIQLSRRIEKGDELASAYSRERFGKEPLNTSQDQSTIPHPRNCEGVGRVSSGTSGTASVVPGPVDLSPSSSNPWKRKMDSGLDPWKRKLASEREVDPTESSTESKDRNPWAKRSKSRGGLER